MNNKSASDYSIPAAYRRMENMHIIFWLLKDISWCLFWKPIGIAMIFPTLIIAIVISYRTRKIKSELSHNLAVVFWISANSYWMISEFLGFDEKLILGYEGKYGAVIPFVIGMLILLYYYLIQRPVDLKRQKAVMM
jgi:hypothetical protein